MPCASRRTRSAPSRPSSPIATATALPSCSTPKIKRGAQPYKTQESCLSLEDLSEVRRFQMVTVAYQVLAGENLVSRTKRLSGWTAEVVQHAIDHCAGKLV